MMHGQKNIKLQMSLPALQTIVQQRTVVTTLETPLYLIYNYKLLFT